LQRLRGLCRPGGSLQIVFGYGHGVDRTTVNALNLPDLDDPVLAARLRRAYAAAGFDVQVREMPTDDVRSLPTTWAKKLAYSGHERRFIEILGHTDIPVASASDTAVSRGGRCPVRTAVVTAAERSATRSLA
jgi:16S rRNA (adenine(1408)-N(1))-methyltransferase